MDHEATPPAGSASPPDFDVQARRHDNVIVLWCRGDLDAVAVPRLIEAIDNALADDVAALIVELSGLDFLASSGMAVLIKGHTAATNCATQFGVVANGPTTSRPMELVGLNELLSVYPTLDDALASAPPTQLP